MVIINKPNAKRFRQERSKRPFAKVLAVVLTLMILVSTFMLVIPTISALQCSPFTHNEEIYIDMTGLTGWDESGANIRVYTYYSDSNENWNVQNNKNDSECYNYSCYQNAITPTKFADHVYTFRITGEKVGYVKVLRLSSDMNTCWNSTGFMYHKDRQGSANCIKITGWNNSAQWSTYAGTGGTGGYQEVNASPDADSITNNANIFPIDATFYDYYTDDEVQSGWGAIRYESSHGYWEPYQHLNNKIAAASSDVSVRYPMYFGNFFDKNDGYTGEGISQMVKFSNWVNNSARLDGTHKAVIGLTGTELVDGNLKYATSGGGTSTVNVPFFDKSFLENNDIGAVVNTKFPMRKVTSNGITTYKFDSSSAGDNAWFSADHKTMYYGQGTTNGAKDALYYYSNPKASSGYGFFPFDSVRGSDKEALDFGFGMRVDIPFNLGGDTGHYGQIKGTNGTYVDQKFTFTGDDDVWVYIDGKLVLDLGGDHQKAKGSINFAGGRGNGTVTIETGYQNPNNATRNTNFTINNYDPTVEHTLTMFYVERGMVESNLSFDFNFAPIGNELIVDKTVNTESVNNSASFKAAVAAVNTFSFNQPTANGKVSSKGTISNSTYTLKNAEYISFKDQFAVPTEMKVTESFTSNFSYTTSWKAIDLVLKGKGQLESAYTIASGNDKYAEFKYQTKDTSSDFVMTRVQLSYVNKPAVAPVTIKKDVRNLGGATDTTEFGGTVKVDLRDGRGFKPYNLAYTTSDGGSYTLSDQGKLATGGKLKNGRTLRFEGIPQGAKVMISEDTSAGYSLVSVTGGESGITVGASGNAITVTNEKLSGRGSLYVKKTLDGENYNGGQFSFKAEGVSKTGYVTGADATADSVTDGKVTFNLTFTQPGDYIYKITENDLSADLAQAGYYKDRSTIYAKFTVAAGATGLAISGDPQYYSDENCTQTTAAEFKNTTEHASITVKKKANTEDPLNDTVFAVVKVKDETPLSKAQINDLINNYSTSYSRGATQTDGTVLFDDLPIYQNGDNVYDHESSQWVGGSNYFEGVVAPQTYMVLEYSPKNGYNTNNTVKYVTFPYESKYNVTFDYVNVAVVTPQSGFGGTLRFILIGFGILGTAALLAMAYVIYDKRCRAARRYMPRHGRK